jgi:hypothetical protein
MFAAIPVMIGCKESSPQYSSIAENDVVAIMNEVERAITAKDTERVIEHMAPFVVIDVTMNSADGPQRVQMSRDQYREELNKVFSKLTHYEYRRENDRISISDDNRRALAESDIFESFVMNGKETRMTTHEKTVMEIIDGKLLVTHVDAVIDKI